MPAIESSRTPMTRLQIDTEYLLRQLPSLIDVKRGHRTWDEQGEKVARHFLAGSKPRNRASHGEAGFEVATWNLAKELVHSAISSEDPEYAAIQKRLGDWRNRPTAALLSTLGLWLAGALGISVTATGPMLATMLYGVAEAGGDWGILIEPSHGDREKF